MVEHGHWLVRQETMATVPAPPSPAVRSPAQLRASTILIVEDEPLVALHLHAVLREAGAGLIAATTADEALRLMSRNDVSAAIVDISLGGQDCLPGCEELSDRRIPFAFYTGHANAEALRQWPEAPVLRQTHKGGRTRCRNPQHLVAPKTEGNRTILTARPR